MFRLILLCLLSLLIVSEKQSLLRRPEPLTTALGLDNEQLKKETAVYTLESGGESFVARLWLWEKARKSIDIQHYIFKTDNTGLVACDYLVKAADRGVKVRLLLDEVAVKLGAHEMSMLDQHKNIEIKIYNPGFRLAKNPADRVKRVFSHFDKLQRRMHVKTITVDGAVSIMGGRNVADEYFDYDDRYNFRDRDIVMFGKAVAQVENVFEQYWNDSLSISLSELVKEKPDEPGEEGYDKLHEYVADTSHFSDRMRDMVWGYPDHFKELHSNGEVVWADKISFVADKPGKNEERENKKGGLSTDSILALLEQAQSSVVIQTPYVVLDDRARQLFNKLKSRGVKVKVLTNSLASTDNDEAFSGYQRDRQEVLGLGIDVFEFKPDAAVKHKLMIPERQAALNYRPVLGLHSKSMVIDNKVCVIGTYNFDPRSADLNTECIAIIRSPKVIRQLVKYMDEEFRPENSWHITTSFNPDKQAGLYKRIKTGSRRVVPKEVL